MMQAANSTQVAATTYDQRWHSLAEPKTEQQAVLILVQFALLELQGTRVQEAEAEEQAVQQVLERLD